MTRRLAILSTLLILAVAAPSAHAQGGAFGPLPPAQATPTATPTPTNSTGETGRNVLFAIGGALILGFGLMGYFLMRDARGAAEKISSRDVLEHERHRSEALHKRQQANKAKQRKKTRAQKDARKVQRQRGR